VRQLRRILRRRLDRWAGRLGYVRRADISQAPVDYGRLPIGPLEALQRSGGRDVIVSVPLGMLRGLSPIGFSFGMGSRHPYVETARRWRAGCCTEYADSALHAYYRDVRPRDGADLLGLDGLEEPTRLTYYTPLATDYPWVAPPGGSVMERRRRWLRRDAAEHGMSGERPLPWPAFGPMPIGSGQFGFARICRVADSIARYGYEPEVFGTGHVNGTVLYEDDRAVVLLGSGDHRVAALAALGADRVPVLLSPRHLVGRSGAGAWPGVRDGAFTVKQALSVFDRLLAGRLPRCVPTVWWPAVVERV
jgi:hypothetical protein